MRVGTSACSRSVRAGAVCRLADERGLEGVTLRDVAARAQARSAATALGHAVTEVSLRGAEHGAEARVWPALADGLTAHVLIGHPTPEEAQEVLPAHLGRLWTHSG
ncbi:hypothetical protein ACIQWN_15580 [Streptomyces vinaceus]|uniref:hypothetical protein n=1 Tax=Streptomyces vinaceus TaxID=1960 RepID=UPI0037FE21AB